MCLVTRLPSLWINDFSFSFKSTWRSKQNVQTNKKLFIFLFRCCCNLFSLLFLLLKINWFSFATKRKTNDNPRNAIYNLHILSILTFSMKFNTRLIRIHFTVSFSLSANPYIRFFFCSHLLIKHCVAVFVLVVGDFFFRVYDEFKYLLATRRITYKFMITIWKCGSDDSLWALRDTTWMQFISYLMTQTSIFHSTLVYSCARLYISI